jgi:hypothetical protein
MASLGGVCNSHSLAASKTRRALIATRAVQPAARFGGGRGEWMVDI